jgi:hypothetical protein
MASDKPERCVCCKAEIRGVSRRGLCMNCYMMAVRAVKRGTVTWAALVAAGKATESRRGLPRSPMAKAIAALAKSR